jgi:4-amino-4-deoxy-L-arabinose transferase-like glycosyltransferase
MLQKESEELREPDLETHRDHDRVPGIGKTLVLRLYFDWLIPVSLLVGLYLRTREWLFDKSLWLDELMVTYSITHRSFLGLLTPLNFNQAAPIGWLWAEHASIRLFGVNDMALRFPDWLASIIALGLFPLVARQLVGRSAVPAAMIIFATSPELIYYADETKQYSFDVACALLALLVTAWLARDRPTGRRAVLWAFSCALLVWCSQPAIAVCAVCGLVLAVRWLRDWQALRKILLAGVILGASVAGDWFATLTNLSSNTNLLTHWRAFGGYPPLHQTIPADLHWLETGVTTTGQFLDISRPFLAVGLMACGLIVVALGRRQFQALLLALPMAAAVALAVTDQYPLARRLALYLLPIGVMLLAAPLALADRERNPTNRWWRPIAVAAAAAALIAVAAPGVALGLSKADHPDQGVTGRQAVAFVSQHQHPGDLVLAQTGLPSVLTMAFYDPHYHIREKGLFYSARPRRNGTCADPFSRHPRATRVWLIFAEFSVGQPPNRNQIYMSQMAVYGKPVLTYNGQDGAAAVLFDLSRPGPRRPLPRHPLTALDCIGIQSPWAGVPGT